MKREAELQVRPLDDGWVEVRIVYEKAQSRVSPHHWYGAEAGHYLTVFVLTFAAGLARDHRAPSLARAIDQLVHHVKHHCGRAVETKH